MADRGGSKAHHVRRAPLGDATDRIINTSPQKREKRSRSQNPQPNPLRAHPTRCVPVKGPSQNGTSLSPRRVASNSKDLAVSRSANHRVSASQHIPTPGVSEANGDQRVSVISTSSCASGGNRKTHIGPWELGKTLGKGSAARVRLARHHTTHDIVAVKILAKNMTQLTAAGSMAELEKWDCTRNEFNSQRQMPLSIEREVAVLKLIDHPNIVKLHDIWENRAEIYLVLEYMDCGDMFTYINACGPIPEFEMAAYFYQILSALEYVHSFNICHRDLKPENILMNSNGVVKIADFGMAAIQQSPTHALKTSCGSPHYAAPELISRSRYQGSKVDIWSLGCLLYATLTRQLPFDDPDGNVPKLLAKAAKGSYVMPRSLSKEAQDLIRKMLTVDPAKRISIRKIWQHPFMLKYEDLNSLNTDSPAPDCRASDRARPVPPEEVDLQILRQLKSMWHTFSEKQIAMQLTNPLPNDQKLFYWLLISYREKKLENYDADLTYSASDYHHLRPVNWRKKFTTAEFPSRYKRVPSRFTVISTVPTDGTLEVTDNATDGGNTTMSYDPYKSSRIIENAHASHAKIVVHRNGSVANKSSRSSTSHRGQSGSFKTASTRSRQQRGGRYINTPLASRPSRQSLSSVQSTESSRYMRPASRRKRGVDFSQVRMKSESQREIAHAQAGIAGSDTEHIYGPATPIDLVRDTKPPRKLHRKIRATTQSMTTMAHGSGNSPPWNEEVSEFSHSIAKDCDDAFNSSLLGPESYLDNTPSRVSVLADSAPPPNRLTTPTPAPTGNLHTHARARPWDHRPLPPTPSPTASAMDVIATAWPRTGANSNNWDTSMYLDRSTFQPNGIPPMRDLAMQGDSNLRISSAPIYSQYSTQWGKDKIPLPSIIEKSRNNDGDPRSRIVSAPAKYQQHETDDHANLEFLSRQDNTIRLVTSPSGKPFGDVEVPKPLNLHKGMSHGATAHDQTKNELNLRERYMHDELASSSANAQEIISVDSTNSTNVKKRLSWFKRRSKDRETIFSTAGESILNGADHLTSTAMDPSPIDAPAPLFKKKSFNLAFWRNSKNEAQAPMSIAESKPSDASIPARMFSHPARPPCGSERADQKKIRNIEPQQSWLARLFRVKPATQYLCFSISRRRARQEIVILLKDWKKYGIRDVEVDKARNIVFARVDEDNYLKMKKVAFAAEIMRVIEHGKRSQLCIVRVTQERGAASSFLKVIEIMNSVFSERGLLVTDKRKSKMMIKTLNS
ncbi:hypothetical protein F5B22DRAFT_474181 [Xylaria bambusicola]|uniref:uncharacterized protein n=1 Tax=Xylaria bambusicola TaxID=326684 RepID=UPI002007F856|nr:uncharacterized protein F5B22DRAFT_474181 [Xylaria bambusicola]KAI0506149.1 hypothetical protein F5B22DRAFT_474181 [Xylaria bambusicola]